MKGINSFLNKQLIFSGSSKAEHNEYAGEHSFLEDTSWKVYHINNNYHNSQHQTKLSS
jgi:hypothetical protein